MKRTYLLKKGTAWDLVRALRDQLGDPTYVEELALYLRDDEDFRVSLTREQMEWVWTDATGIVPGLHGGTRQRIFMGTGSLKNKLLFVARHLGARAHISIVPMLRFTDNASGVRFEVRPESSVGENVAITVPARVLGSEEANRIHEAFVNDYVHPYLSDDDLAERTEALNPKLENFIDFDMGARGVLHPRILDFCKKNGMVSIKDGTTLGDVLHSKSNDYSFYEVLFRELTGVELLSRHDHCDIPAGQACKLSVIIPCYNAERTIHRTLASMAAQELPPAYVESIEVILVDDNSSVPVRDVVDMEAYPFKVECLSMSNNHGVCHAREVGVAHAAGDILLFVDADVLLSRNYVADHVARNAVVGNAVFVSFKENVGSGDPRISDQSVQEGLDLPNYQKDLRIQKNVKAGAIGSYEVSKEHEVTILEDSNFFKDFSSRVFGVYDLSCMITGHNFSMRRETAEAIKPFPREFRNRGWGMEDVALGLKALAGGCYIIPVLSCGVFHIDHEPRSGSEEKKRAEYAENTKLIEEMLGWRA